MYPNMRIRAVIALGIVLAWCAYTSALDPSLDISQYAHTAWKVRDGFSKGSISSIAQTPDGYLWLGTEFGLLRFDGVRAIPWQPPVGEELPSSDIRGLVAARDGALWIATSKGLVNWKGGKLTHYPELAGKAVDALLEDREGAVWAGALGIPTGRLCAMRSGIAECYGNDGSLGRGVLSLCEDSGGNLWVGGLTGLWRWKPGPPKFYPMPDLGLNGIQGLTKVDNGALLIAAGSVIRQLVDGKVEAYPLPGIARPFKPLRLLRDRNDGLWIGTGDRGLLHMYQGRTDAFAQSDGLSGNFILTLFEDREGNIWIATSDGLDRFRDYAVPTISIKQGLSSALVWSVLAARDSSVWLGTLDGLNRWKDGQITIYRKRNGLADDAIGSLFEDDRARIWVAAPGGVAYFENGRFVPADAVPGGIVHSIAGNGAGSLWISNQNEGLFHLLGGKVVEQISWAKLGRKDFAMAMLPDRVQGGLWLGFFQSGLAYLKDGRILASYTATDALGHGRINDLQFDPDGTLWAATEGGLSRVKDGHVTTLTSRNGLPCDAVHWAMEDDVHSVWLYTACGLVRIARSELDAWVSDPKRTIQTTVFDSSDGVRSHLNAAGFSPRVAKSTDGRIWFLPWDGVSVIDPRHLAFNQLPPPVHIEQVSADGKSYDASSGLRLPPLVRDLEIDYTGLSFVAPEKVLFRYKLEGWDRDWQNVGNRRQAFYTNLAPGHYRFRVTACNNSGVWNEAGTFLDFSIAPAYWQTTWFRALCVLAFLAIFWTIYQLRVRALERRQAVLERHQAEIRALNEQLIKAQEAERIRIAGELHDGVLQQITSVTLRLGKVRNQAPPDSEARATVSAVQQQLIKIGTDIRHISHELHPALLQEAGLPAALSAYCEEFSNVRGLPVSCETDESVQELSPGAALCIYRIAQEALGNAAKYSQAKKVEVRLTRANGRVRLSVTDDGVGCDPSQIARSGGLGVINMRERMLQLNGTFEFDSAPGRGTTVRVEIPFRPAS